MSTGFDFAPAADIVFDEGIENDEDTSGANEEAEIEDDAYYGPEYTDSVVEELARSKEEVETLRGTIHSDPLHPRSTSSAPTTSAATCWPGPSTAARYP